MTITDQTTDTARAPFTFDGDYLNVEQVRPFYPAYLKRLTALQEAKLYPYNDLFRGRIEGLTAETQKAEDTAIYLLQRLRDREEDAARVAEFIERGAVSADALPQGETWRGDVVEMGFYVGGTGWRITRKARLTRDTRGRLILTGYRKRYGSQTDGRVYILRAEVAA